MITPFRIIKNEYLRENTQTEPFWKHVFMHFCQFLENKFLENYNIIDNNIKSSRLLEIERFADEILSINNIYDYLLERYEIIQEGGYTCIAGERFPTVQISIACNKFDQLKRNLTKKKIMWCFNLTPIREPHI